MSNFKITDYYGTQNWEDSIFYSFYSGTSFTESFNIKFTPTEAKDYFDSLIINVDNGAAVKNVYLKGKGINAPSFSAEPSNLNFGEIPIGSTSNVMSYMLTANNVTSDITIKASNGFQVSMNGNDFDTILNVAPSKGNINKTIYARYIPIDDNPNVATIVHTYAGQVIQSIAVSVNANTGIKKQKISYFEIYPNPNNGMFKIKLPNLQNGKAMVEITDLTGRIVHNEIMNESHELILNVKKGVYLVKVIVNNESTILKLIVE